MFEKRFFVGTIVFIGILHLFATLFHWYFFLWWYDVMMHAFGGFAMGIAAVLFWRWVGVKNLHPHAEFFARLVFVIGFVAIIGICWEWMEALCDVWVFPAPDPVHATQLGLVDTMLDLYFDLFGAFLAWTCSFVWKP